MEALTTTLKIVGVVVGVLVILILLLFLAGALQSWAFAINVVFPGVAAQKKNLGESRTGVISSSSAVIPVKNLQRILFCFDGNSIESMIKGAQWRIHLFMTIHNFGVNPIFVYDMHAHLYCWETEIFTPASILYERPKITLYQDNSILLDGREYQINNRDLLGFELVFDISRHVGLDEPVPGMVFSIFALFFDYRCFNDHELVHRRVPSQDIFCFQDRDQTGQANGSLRKIDDQYIRNDSRGLNKSMNGRKMMKAFREAFEKHKSLGTEFSI